MTKKERLAKIDAAANDAHTELKASKQEAHDLPEVFNMFGSECAATLNQYACAVEDALIEQVAKLREHKQALEIINIERKQLDLENGLLHRRLNLISDLINRKQVDDISELMHQPL